jgi:hypothetical protein
MTVGDRLKAAYKTEYAAFFLKTPADAVIKDGTQPKIIKTPPEHTPMAPADKSPGDGNNAVPDNNQSDNY